MFAIGIPDALLTRLNELAWWRDILAYRYHGAPLFIALRDGYISVYVNGRAIYKKIELSNGNIRGIFDRRYFYDASANSGDLWFDGLNLCDRRTGQIIDGGAKIIQALDKWVPRIANYGFVNLSDEIVTKSKKEIGEKECLATRAIRPEVINLEMALKGFKNPAGKKIAPRIDMVHLEESGTKDRITCVFTEAKLYINKYSLRKNGDFLAPVIDQVLSYKQYIKDNSDYITDAYKECCRLLVEIRRRQDVFVHKMLEDVANDAATLELEIVPRVLVFDEPVTLSASSEKRWQFHKDKITGCGIKLETVKAQG